MQSWDGKNANKRGVKGPYCLETPSLRDANQSKTYEYVLFKCYTALMRCWMTWSFSMTSTYTKWWRAAPLITQEELQWWKWAHTAGPIYRWYKNKTNNSEFWMQKFVFCQLAKRIRNSFLHLVKWQHQSADHTKAINTLRFFQQDARNAAYLLGTCELYVSPKRCSVVHLRWWTIILETILANNVALFSEETVLVCSCRRFLKITGLCARERIF